MSNSRALVITGLAIGMGVAGTARAAEILVGNPTPGRQAGDVIGTQTWTANNTYNLQDQIYVAPGATLTIEAGTRVATTPTGNGGGSLAVTRGAMIFVQGTKANPVVMTSTADDGTWRQTANEWGNLTIMGNGLISASHFGGVPVEVCGVQNTKDPSGLNRKVMEGLTAIVCNEPECDELGCDVTCCDQYVLYGGADDDDDSGSISYLSLRYTGRVIGLGNELNGLSLGALGRETDISHVEVMNNVDDGIEIWGGTVNIAYANIWNIGDDSFDIDEGWRGKAQNIFVVQGYSLAANQGSGVGDNCFETDGAEDSDAQPVTTATIYNATVIGQPFDGDGGTVWRDNARVQYRNCLFMDVGAGLVQFDDLDGDGAQGYGHNGTLSWADTWTTSYTHSQDLGQTVSGCIGCSPRDFNHPSQMYLTQTSGTLAEISDSVFFNVASYGTSDAVGVTIAGDDNPALDNVVVDVMPIQSIARAAPAPIGPQNKVMSRVTSIDPRPVNEAATSAGVAPNDGFFQPSQWRGAFAANQNWALGWTAADEFGLLVEVTCPWDIDGSGSVGTADLLAVLAAWGNPGPADFDGSGAVGTADLLALLANWGGCP